MNPHPSATVTVLAQIEGLGAKASGILAQVITILLGIVVAWVTIIVIWKLLQEMTKNPDYGKLLAIVGVGLFAVFLVGAAPDALDAAYAYGQSFLSE